MRIDLYKDKGASCKKCHDMDSIICEFCFCPLYGEDCGGNFVILESGIKDCSDCTRPHEKEFVESFTGYVTELMVFLSCEHILVKYGEPHVTRVWDVKRLDDELIVCPYCGALRRIEDQFVLNKPVNLKDPRCEYNDGCIIKNKDCVACNGGSFYCPVQSQWLDTHCNFKLCTETK